MLVGGGERDLFEEVNDFRAIAQTANKAVPIGLVKGAFHKQNVASGFLCK